MIKAVHKAICSVCKGNGFIRVPYELSRDEQWADCEVCKSEGELTYDEKDITKISDGLSVTDSLKRLQ